MYKDHVRVVAGMDAAGPRVAGYFLHDELGYLVRSGLSPLETLQAATLNPTIAFNRTADLGIIEPGNLADMVLLDSNPLEKIENTQRISAVVHVW